MSEQIIKYDTSIIESDKKEVNDIKESAAIYIIEDQEDYDFAGELLKNIRSMAKNLEEKRKTITSPMDAAKKAVMALFNPMSEELENADKLISKKRIEYFGIQESKRIAEENRLAKIAKDEEDKRKKELEEQAKKWEEKGNAEKAEERRQQAQSTYIAPKQAQTIAPKTKGIALVDNWKGEVTDLMSLIKAVAVGKAPISFLEANMPNINKQAGSTKDTLQFPGIKFVNKPYERAGK